MCIVQLKGGGGSTETPPPCIWAWASRGRQVSGHPGVGRYQGIQGWAGIRAYRGGQVSGHPGVGRASRGRQVSGHPGVGRY